MAKKIVRGVGTSTRKTGAARETGLDVSKIGTVNLQLAKLRQLGLLVDIDVSGLSMFSVAATWRELGITDQDERRQRLKAGSKSLYSDRRLKELHSCESTYRQIFHKYTFEVTGFLPYRWMAFTAYNLWRKEAQPIEDRFAEIRSRMIAEHDKELDVLAEDEAVFARRAWSSAQAHGYSAVMFGGQAYQDEAAFIDSIVGAAAARFPSKSRIESELRMNYRTAILEDGADVEAEALAEERQRQKRQDLRRAEQTKDAKAQAEIEAVRQAELEHQRQILAEMKSPLDEIVSDVRGRVLEIVQGMIESVNKNGFLRGKVAEQGSGLLEFVQIMTMGADRDLENALTKLKAKIGPVGKDRAKNVPERDIEEIKTALSQIVNLAEKEAENVTATGRFAAIEL